MKKKRGLLFIIYCMFLLNSCNNDSDEVSVESESYYVKEDSTEKISDENINKIVETLNVVKVNNETVETLVIKDTRTVIKERDYKGKIGNSDIHMTLKYYNDGTVDGSYFYDKYQMDIIVLGIKEYDTIMLYSDELNETFEGFISGSCINGEWQNSINSEKFFVWNENYDEYQTSNSLIENDNEYFYFGKENSIYKSDFEENNTTKIYEGDYEWNLYIYSKYIYYINVDNQLCRIDINGENKEVIVDDVVSEYLIYKDKIYYTTYEAGYLQLNSVDLLGNGLNKIELPKLYYDGGMEKEFYLDCIYNDYVYFSGSEKAGTSIFRMKIDGTDKKEFDRFASIIGFANDKMIINYNTTEIDVVDAENLEEVESLYDEVNWHLNADVEDYVVVNNDDYIVFAYKLFDEDFYNFIVLSIDGEILNEIKLDIDEYFSISILNEYVYLFDDYKESPIARINLFGDELEFIKMEIN